MLSNPYPSKGTAKSGAKVYAAHKGLTKFFLILDIEKKRYYFSDEESAPKAKMIVFGRFQLVKGKWRDKTPLGKVTFSRGGVVKNENIIVIRRGCHEECVHPKS